MEKIKDMRKYWSEHSDQYLDSDQQGWGAVIYTGMPRWFNQFAEIFQKKVFSILTSGVDYNKKLVLDAGCGVGRWCAYLWQKGARVIGVDIDTKRLEKTREDIREENIEFLEMRLENLDFDDGHFDLVNSVTVLQHIPYETKKKAIEEICRVTKSGGYISVIELIDVYDDAPQVFPLKVDEWISEFENNGCKLIKSCGYEYIPVLRFLRRVQNAVKGRKTIKRMEGEVKMGPIECLVLRLVVYISYPIEFLCMKILPIRFARHGAFLFKKI